MKITVENFKIEISAKEIAVHNQHDLTRSFSACCLSR